LSVHASRTCASEAETRQIGRTLGTLLRGGDVLLLEGALGAGKTMLVRAIAEGMGIETGAVASPTFVVVHEYTRSAPTFEQPSLIHVDAYRLHGPDELDTLGWDSVMQRVHDGAAALLVEWPERLGPRFRSGLAPAVVSLEHAGEHTRSLDLMLPDSWVSRSGIEDLLNRRATTCPITGETVPADSPTYPFSSERARLADLHKWFSGGYQISREAGDNEEEA
jgi:tRNA threonylcarbamoyladenosine biosynthesis protein TsaE